MKIKDTPVKFQFETIRLIDKKDSVRFVFQKIFYFEIDKKELDEIGMYDVHDHYIKFKTDGEGKANNAEKRFNAILAQGFGKLKSLITKKPATYVHRNSGIPLIGNNSFGIVDRNTNIIELKPVTGCNLDCIFCSVPDCNRTRDFIVEEEYIIEELGKIIHYKQCDDIEAHIGTQGEPLLYGDIVKLVSDLKKIPQIKRITMNTNGTVLTKKLADELLEAGLTRFNMSINSLNPGYARKIADAQYDINHIVEITKYLAKKTKARDDCREGCVHIAPVVMFGINDKDMDELVEFAKELGIDCCIQNFLEYKGGLRPAKQKSWEYFKEFLSGLEKRHKIKLLLDFKEDFQLKETKPLPRLFRKNDIVNANVACEGRLKNEWIAVYNRDGIARSISFIDDKRSHKIGRSVKLKIVSLKHNIAVGTVVH